MIRPGCWSFVQSTLEELQGSRLHSLYGPTVPLSDCPHGTKKKSLYPVWTSPVSTCAWCPSAALHSCEESNSVSSVTSLQALGAAMFPKAISAPARLSLAPSASLHRASTPVLTISVASPEILPASRCLSCSRVLPTVEQENFGQLCVCDWDGQYQQLVWGSHPWVSYAQVPSTGAQGQLLGRLAVWAQLLEGSALWIPVYIYRYRYAYIFLLTNLHPAQPERRAGWGFWCCLCFWEYFEYCCVSVIHVTSWVYMHIGIHACIYVRIYITVLCVWLLGIHVQLHYRLDMGARSWGTSPLLHCWVQPDLP